MAAAVIDSQTKVSHYKYTDEELDDFIKKLTKLRNDKFAGVPSKPDEPLSNPDEGRVLPQAGNVSIPQSSPRQVSRGDLEQNGSSSTVKASHGPQHISNTGSQDVIATTVHSKSSTPAMPLAGPSKIDPVLLTKSDVLVKAEVQQKRQRLENNLNDQYLAGKNTSRDDLFDQEAAPDYDVADILRRAHLLVRPVMSGSNHAVPAGASSIDSFDENTFYSSQMNESTSAEEVEEPRPNLPRRLCRFFLNDKPCPYGSGCTFSHDPILKRSVDMLNSQPTDENNVVNAESHADPHKDKAQVPSLADKNAAPPPASQTQITNVVSSPEQDEIAQLEARIRVLREGQLARTKSSKSQAFGSEARSKATAPSPQGLDEFGREISLRAPKDSPARTTKVPASSIAAQAPQLERPQGIRSPRTAEFPVYRNHIASPAAPQAARISPLAVKKISQVSHDERNQDIDQLTSGLANTEVLSNGQGANGFHEHLDNPRKRRRGGDADEESRNVVRRRGPSPVVRIKQEPISPPPYQSAQPRRGIPSRHNEPQIIYLDSTEPQSRLLQPAVYERHDPEREIRVQEVFEQAPLASTRRAGSRTERSFPSINGPDARRVASESHFNIPKSPLPYPAPPVFESRANHASAQAGYGESGRGPVSQHRSSTQPRPIMYTASDRSPSPPNWQTREAPVGATTTTMAPPSRRIMIDQYGRRFVEPEIRQVSVAPTSRRPPTEPLYEPLSLRSASAVRTRYFDPEADDRPRLMRRPSPPSSIQYVNSTSQVNARRAQDEEMYGGRYDPQLVYEEVRSPAQHEQAFQRPREASNRVQSVRPADDYQANHRQYATRVSSVRPQPRIVQLAERQSMPLSPQYARPRSDRPVLRDMSPASYQDEERVQYQYALPGQMPGYRRPSREYLEEVHDDGVIYEAPRQVVRRM